MKTKEKEHDLKHCPFCGGKAEIKKCHHSKKFYVFCTGCGVETSRYLFDKAAQTSWNTRV